MRRSDALILVSMVKRYQFFQRLRFCLGRTRGMIWGFKRFNPSNPSKLFRVIEEMLSFT